MKHLDSKNPRPLSSPRRVAVLIGAVLFWAFNIFVFQSHLIAVSRLPDDAPPIVPDMLVYQSTDYSCGPASLSTLFRYYNIIKSEREWGEIAGTNITVGTRINGLINAGTSLGFDAVEISPTFDQLKYICHPSILFQSREYHLVSFWGLDESGKAIIRDPALGISRWDSGRYDEATPFNPKILVFYPGQIPICDQQSATPEIIRCQNMLIATGHFGGKVNGIWSDNLARSISDFQTDMHLEPTGIVDKVTSIYLEGAWRFHEHGPRGPFLMTDRESGGSTGFYVQPSQIISN